MKIIYTLLFALLLPVAVCAQTTMPYDGRIEVAFPDYTMEGSGVTFPVEVDFSNLDLSTIEMVELTPVLRSTKTANEKRFAPIVVTGRQRGRIIARAERLGTYAWEIEPAEVIVLKRNSARIRRINIVVPFEKWMRNSELVLEETCTACCNQRQEYEDGSTLKTYERKTPYVFPGPYQPTYAVSYVEPEVQPVKVMSDTYSARLQFASGKSQLLQSHGNNAAVLSEVDRVIGSLKQDSLLTLKRIVVKGYASPEGSSSSNYNLSVARAQAFVNYLNQTHRYRSTDRMIVSQGMGEDWDGLRKLLQQANPADLHAILQAIDGSSDNDRRERSLKALNGGRTWRTLLTDYFPELRRNEYTIEYEVRGFNTQEAKSLIWTRPQLLSLNEMFMVANLYAPESQEYKDVFNIATRMYPESPVAQLNTAAMEIKSGVYDSAIARLKRMDTPEARNNLGVAFWHKGEYEKALESFTKAAQAGSDTARQNIEQYNRWFADKD